MATAEDKPLRFLSGTLRKPVEVDALLAPLLASGYAVDARRDLLQDGDYNRITPEQLGQRLGITRVEWDAWRRWKDAGKDAPEPFPKQGRSSAPEAK